MLSIFLPTCDKEQLKEFFGPIKRVICEDEYPSFAFIFSLSYNTNELKIERVSVENVFKVDNIFEEVKEERISESESKEIPKPIRKWKFLVDDDETS